MSNIKTSAQWDRKGTESDSLINLFKLHKSKHGQAGISPSLTKPAQIKDQVYNKYKYLQKFARERFPDNFKSLVQDYNLNKDITTGHRGELMMATAGLSFCRNSLTILVVACWCACKRDSGLRLRAHAPVNTHASNPPTSSYCLPIL